MPLPMLGVSQSFFVIGNTLYWSFFKKTKLLE